MRPKTIGVKVYYEIINESSSTMAHFVTVPFQEQWIQVGHALWNSSVAHVATRHNNVLVQMV